MRSNRLTLFLLTSISSVATAQDSPAGCWAGTVDGVPAPRRAVLELARVNGDWNARMVMLVRNTDPDPVSNLVIQGDSVRFQLPTTPGSPTFAGKVDHDVLSGTVLGRTTQSFSLARVRDTSATTPLKGHWFGWLSQNGAEVLRLGLNILPAPCGQLLVTLDSPDQGSSSLPTTHVSVRGDSLFLEMSYIKGAFQGGLAGDSLIGTWTQNGATMGLRLGRRDSAVTSTRRPQDPVAPFPYTEENVVYNNPADGTRLAGTLTMPPGTGPFPAALLITGSGAQDRNEALMGHKPFLVIADYLTRRGIAVLRVDDRGVGGSSGNIMNATISDNAGDALAGVEFLRHHGKVDSTRVGLIGHSEGGWVAPLAASRSGHVAYVVLLAGPAVTGEAIRYAQDSVLALATGASYTLVSANHKISYAMNQVLKAEPNDALALDGLLRVADSAYRRLTPPEKAAIDSSRMLADTSALRQRLTVLTTPWYRYLVSYDPVPALRALRVPMLALFGDRDLQVPAKQSVPVMERVMAGRPGVTIRVLPGLNHLFQHAETGLVAEYARIDETISPEVMRVIGDWILHLT
jgi:pimeloyl-ACP methyl ester carboxylesterase